MNKLEYYAESIRIAADERDPPIELTEEEIEWLAESVLVSIENESLAFGYDCIPNPLQSELDAQKGILVSDRREHAQEISKLNERLAEHRRTINRLEWEIANARST